MHIPDNYLSPQTCAVMGAIMIPIWILSIKKVSEQIPKIRFSKLGIGAALPFLIMMFNIALPGGTTGHAVGGTLVAILLGPFAACISLTITLLIQALLYGDGGILAFGANCFNIAFVLPFLGYFVYNFFKTRIKTQKGEYLGIILGSYLGIVAAALCAAIEFGIQPLLFKDAAGAPLFCPFPLSVSIPAMVVPHLIVVGVAEVIITVAIFAFIKFASTEQISGGLRFKKRAIYSLFIALACLSPLGLLASGTAWGEWGIDEIKTAITNGESLGFIPNGMLQGFHFKTLIPDYTITGLPEHLGYIVSALIGIAIPIAVFGVLSLLTKLLRKKRIESFRQEEN